MRFTQWFKFKKPEPFDTVNINDLNDSFDLIDEKLKETVDENKNLLTMFKNLIINAGNSNAEVAASRGDFDYLPNRLNNFDLSLIGHKNELLRKANQIDLEVESKRIDNLVANNNTTQGNSELMDIRVSKSGKTYTSAGEAIRAISTGRELTRKVFTSCFVEDNPQYVATTNEAQPTIFLKEYIVDIQLDDIEEDIIVAVGRVTKQPNLYNLVGLYKCNSQGVPDGSEGIFFYIPNVETNDRQVIENTGIINGRKITGRIVIKNWANLPIQDTKGINYKVGGISNRCFINTRFNLATDKDINNLDLKVNNNTKALNDKIEVIQNRNNFNNSNFLEELVENIELIGFDTSMKMSLSMVRKNFTRGGTIAVQNKVGIYRTEENGEANPEKGIIIDIKPEEANSIVKRVVKTTYEGKQVEIRITLNWFKITEDDFSKEGISNFSVAGISYKNYKQKYDLIYDKVPNFNNCSFLEELIEDIELIGFNKEDKILLSMVRRNYTKGGTTELQNKIGIYKIDPATNMANPNMGIFIELPEEIQYDAPIRKHIKTKFDGDEVELKISINWYKLKDVKELDANGVYNLSRFDVAGIQYKNYSEKIDETTKDVLPVSPLILSKNYVEKPIITFVDDDGSKTFLTKTKPVFDKHQVKCSLGIVTKNATSGSIGHLQTSDLKILQGEGYDILSHSHTHDSKLYKPGFVTESDEVIEADIKASYEYIRDNGFGTNAIVYPWGSYADKDKYLALAQKYFDYGINSGTSGTPSAIMTEDILESMYYKRKFINDSTSIDTYKSLIDSTLNKKGWLIFGIHSGIEGEVSSNTIDQIISYVKEKGIDILTFSEANKIKQNICSIGVYGAKGKSLYIGRAGVILN